MAQSLCINEKEYLPSTQLAKRFSYTSDYISKLAREEKVLATRVGRQWFVEPESLRLYIQQLEIEKKISKEKLSRQRKIERGQNVSVAKADSPKSANSMAQAMVVMLLGSTVGLLGWGAIVSGLTSQDLVRGAEVVLESFEDRLSTDVSVLWTSEVVQHSVANPLLVPEESRHDLPSQSYLMDGTGPQFERVGVYTTFPVVTASTTDRGYVNTNFSDEVLVTEEGGEMYVQPVLRDVVGEPHQLSSSEATKLTDE